MFFFFRACQPVFRHIITGGNFVERLGRGPVDPGIRRARHQDVAVRSDGTPEGVVGLLVLGERLQHRRNPRVAVPALLFISLKKFWIQINYSTDVTSITTFPTFCPVST